MRLSILLPSSSWDLSSGCLFTTCSALRNPALCFQGSALASRQSWDQDIRWHKLSLLFCIQLGPHPASLVLPDSGSIAGRTATTCHLLHQHLPNLAMPHPKDLTRKSTNFIVSLNCRGHMSNFMEVSIDALLIRVEVRTRHLLSSPWRGVHSTHTSLQKSSS